MGKRLAASHVNLIACPCAAWHGERTGKATGLSIGVGPCPCHPPAQADHRRAVARLGALRSTAWRGSSRSRVTRLTRAASEW